MITHRHDDIPTAFAGRELERVEEPNNCQAVRPPVDHVTRADENLVASNPLTLLGPVGMIRYNVIRCEKVRQSVKITVNVADGNDIGDVHGDFDRLADL